MQITIGFKTPDAINNAIEELDLEVASDDPGEIEEIKEEIKRKLEKWIQYGEKVRIMFDLDKMTAEVVC